MEHLVNKTLEKQGALIDTLLLNHNHRPEGKDMKQNLHHKPGEIVGNYRLVSCLGQGGCGEVWKAEHVELAHRYEVIKFAIKPEFQEILRHEGFILHHLSHPSFVQITDMDTKSDPPYLRMEYIAEMTLDQKLQQEGRLPWQQVVKLIREMANALKVAHQKNIFHGDLKPSNIFMCKDGIKISDFGLATFYTQNRETFLSGSLKEPEEIKLAGTWEYMSPEQKNGEIGPYSDVYALGVIMYQALTGELPRSIHPPSHFVSDCPGSVDELVSKMLASKKERFQTISQLEDAITNCSSKTSPLFAWIGMATGILLIMLALGFTPRVPATLFPLVLAGLVCVELSRPHIPKFWPLLLFWLGTGLSLIWMMERFYYFIGIPIIFAIFGALWLLLSPDEQIN